MTFPGFVDRVYLDAPSELHLDNGLGDVITMKNTKYELEAHFIFFCYPHDFSHFTLRIHVFYYAVLLTPAVGQMLFCGTHICKWKHATKILFVLKMHRY